MTIMRTIDIPASTNREEEHGREQEEEEEDEGEIIRTWGTGTGRTTMSLHLRKSYYKKLGWNIGDFLYLVPDFEKGIVTIKKVDKSKL